MYGVNYFRQHLNAQHQASIVAAIVVMKSHATKVTHFHLKIIANTPHLLVIFCGNWSS
ncbi:TPA: hypothetical protein KYC80_004640 [Escherichia coli]|nr:hypothetical protein [Escherichia coli]